jgi:hypothetical protein
VPSPANAQPHSNQISVIPDAIAQCPALQSLDLDSNQISVIPDAIAQCPALQSLDLDSNQISVIPKTYPSSSGSICVAIPCPFPPKFWDPLHSINHRVQSQAFLITCVSSGVVKLSP